MSNNIHEAFDKIRASRELKESTRQFLQTRRASRERAMFPIMLKKVIVGICVLFVLVVGGGGYYVVKTPVSYVSIDVNPSIELTLNRFDRVISATAYNEDANSILEHLDVEGKAYSEAVDVIVMSEAMQPYLTDNGVLVFTVASEVSDKASVILADIQNGGSFRKNNVEGRHADVSLIAEAHAHDMSLGKYAAYCELSQYDDTVTAEDCHDMTMSEIHERIHECGEHGHHGNSGDWGTGGSNGCHGD